MPYQVDDALLHAMSGTELSRVRTELRLLPPEPNNQRLLASRGADIVMQSSTQPVRSHLKSTIGPSDRSELLTFGSTSSALLPVEVNFTRRIHEHSCSDQARREKT
jgi:hypothetical protein